MNESSAFSDDGCRLQAASDPNNDPRIVYEQVTRCLCGGDLMEGPIWEWQICSSCGTWVNTKRPAEISLADVYGETYWTTTQELAGTPTLEQRFNRDMNDRIPVYLDALLPHLVESARICELGCGNARLLHELKLRGYHVIGTEFDSSVITRLTELTDVQILQGNSEQFPDESFDAVISIDVLEHVHNPGKFLQENARLLRPGGVMLLHTPVHDQPQTPYRYSVGLLWKLYHLYLFSRDLLLQLIDDAGFRVLDDKSAIFGWTVFILQKR